MPYGKGMLHQHGRELSIVHRTLDAAIILVSLILSARGHNVPFSTHYQLAALVAIIGFQFFAEWRALYESWRVNAIRDEAWKILWIWALVFGVMLSLSFLSKSSTQFSRVVITAWAVSAPILLVAERVLLRFVLRRFRQMGLNSRAVAIVGFGRSTSELIGTIENSPWMGLRIEGVYDTGRLEQHENLSPGRDIEMLLQHVKERRVDAVYITYPMQQEEKIRRLIESLADSTVSVHVVPDVLVSDLLHARWTNLGAVPLVSVFESSIYGANDLVKRMEDIILGSIILLLISPVMLVIACAVKLSSPGPVLFKQKRYGLNGQVIEVWKFRSMVVMEDGINVPQAQKNDPRVTRLGAFLRKASLDELPQFINVLQGQMSIVGPRPHAVTHNEQYRKLIHGYMLRHKVKPGITGWAQVHGWRGETDTIEKMEKRIQYDLDYINNWSLWLDIKIILMTIFGGMRGKNAY